MAIFRHRAFHFVRRGAGHTARTVGLVLTFALSFVAAFVIHFDRPVARRLVARVTTAALAPLFRGKIVAERIDHLGLDGVDVGLARVVDAHGKVVIEAHGIHVRTPLPRLARRVVTALVEGGDIVIRLDDTWIDNAEASLDGGDLTLAIAEAFQTNAGPEPTTPAPSAGPARVVRVEMPHIHLAHARARGEPVPGTVIDGEASRVSASLAAGTEGATLDVDRSPVATHFLAPYDAQGTGDYHLRVGPGSIAMWAGFNGSTGGVETVASWKFTDGKMGATVDAPRVVPSDLRPLIPNVPDFAPATAHFEMEGYLPDMTLTGRVVSGQGELDVDGLLHLASPLKIETDFTAKDIDPRDFVPTAPTASLGGIGHVTFALTDAGPTAQAMVSTQPATIAGVYVPPLTAFAKLEGGVVTGTADVHEPEAQAHASFRVDRNGTVDGDVTAAADRLDRLPQIAGAIEGGAKVAAHVHVEAQRLDVDATADVRGLGKGSTKVDGASVRARIGGPFSAPRLSAAADAHGLHAGDQTYARARVTADGPLAGPHRLTARVSDPRWDDLTATATLDLRSGATVSGAKVLFRQGETVADADVERLTVDAHGVRASGVRAGGSLGTAQGTAAIENGALRIDLEGKLDLKAIARVVPSVPITNGEGRYSIHVRETDAGHDGKAELTLEKLEVLRAPFRGAVALDVDLAGHHAHGVVQGSVTGPSGKAVAHLGASADADLVGRLTAKTTWEHATYDAKIDDLSTDLDALFAEPLVKLALSEGTPIEKLGGLVHLAASASRKTTSGLPVTTVSVSTDKLVVARSRPERGGRRRSGPVLKDVDASVTFDLAPAAANDPKGAADTRLRVSATVHDQTGEIAYADVATTSDPAALLQLLRDMGDEGNVQEKAFERLEALPLAGRAAWSPRPLDGLPEIIRPAGLTGKISANVDLTGTFGHPHALAAVRGEKLVATIDGIDPWPVDFAFQAQVGDARVETLLRVLHDDAEVANVGAYVDVDVNRALWDFEGDRHWKAGGLVELRGFQLEALPQVASAGLRGRVSGTLSVSGVHEHPKAELDLQILRGALLGGQFPMARVQGHIAEGASVLTASVRQAGTRVNPDGGTLQLTTLASLRFLDGFLPVLDPGAAQTFAVRAARFDVAPFSALAEPAIEGLAGEVAGEVSFSVIGDKEKHRPSLQDFRGTMLWSSGELSIPQIGQTFTDGRVSLDAHREGDAVLFTAKDLSLAATTGDLRGSATAVLPTDVITLALFGDEEGALDERSLLAIRAALSIAKSEKIPVTAEGVSLGDAYGSVDLDLDLRRHEVDVAVAVPDLHFELPDGATRQVQDLSDNPEVGVVDRRPTRRRGGGKATATKIVVRLGLGAKLEDLLAQNANDRGVVGITRPGLLEVYVRGRPTLTIDDTGMHMTGTIETAGGQITALGKQFLVQPGYLRFDDDPTNPSLNLSARWDTPTSVRVYADVTGTAAAYKLHFRSEPSRPEADVVSLVLFGRERTQNPGDVNDQSGAGALGGGVASTVLNQLINPVQIFGRRLETRVDTSSSTNTKVGIATEIRPNLWAQVDVSTANQQQRQNQDVSTVTLDWRFRTNWSLRTTVGDRGSSIIDLLWQYRY